MHQDRGIEPLDIVALTQTVGEVLGLQIGGILFQEQRDGGGALPASGELLGKRLVGVVATEATRAHRLSEDLGDRRVVPRARGPVAGTEIREGFRGDVIDMNISGGNSDTPFRFECFRCIGQHRG